jgi:DNA polymerase III delta prime subunit
MSKCLNIKHRFRKTDDSAEQPEEPSQEPPQDPPHEPSNESPQQPPHDPPQDPPQETPEEPPHDDRKAGNPFSMPTLPPELDYLDQLIRYRIGQVLHPASPAREPVMPPYEQWKLPIGQYILHYNISNKPPLSIDDTRLLLMALAYHVQPFLFDNSINSMLNGENEFPRIGGVRGKNFRGFIPTGETAVFLLAGDDWKKSLDIQELFWADHVFAQQSILWLGDVEQGEPQLGGKIMLSQDYVDLLAHNRVLPPHHNANFPASEIATPRERSDLVINDQLKKDFDHLLDWIRHKDQVDKTRQNGKKGYRCLFHGPPGTGKTFAAKMLGKEAGKEVYRIDLSRVVSKYIGETEKNLELLFARAENKDWILFFDEADALFGKRIAIRESNDKYANQEVSYLLQRIEDYDGLVILATNKKNNIDDSFLRRFDMDMEFEMPRMPERINIWQISFPKDAGFSLEEKVEEKEAGEPSGEKQKPLYYSYLKRKDKEDDKKPETEAQTQPTEPQPTEPPPPPQPGLSVIMEMVKKYALSGASIQNVVRYATIRATSQMEDGKLTLHQADIRYGIRRELIKNGIPLERTARKKKSN